MFRQLLLLLLIMCSWLVKAQTPHEPHVVLNTSMGEIELALNAQKAPVTVKNFLGYVEEGFYNNTIFHRVIPSFMIQGGGFTAAMQQKVTHPPISNESNNELKNIRGSVAMARTSQPDSATSQFFINLTDNPFLDYGQRNPGYTVFGQVVKGMSVVDKIAQVATQSVGVYGDVPSKPVIIISAKVVK